MWCTPGEDTRGSFPNDVRPAAAAVLEFSVQRRRRQCCHMELRLLALTSAALELCLHCTHDCRSAHHAVAVND